MIVEPDRVIAQFFGTECDFSNVIEVDSRLDRRDAECDLFPIHKIRRRCRELGFKKLTENFFVRLFLNLGAFKRHAA